jgi:hypothetical protein
MDHRRVWARIDRGHIIFIFLLALHAIKYKVISSSCKFKAESTPR